MPMIGPVIKIIRVLQSNTDPREIAAGGVLALYFGLTPLNHTHVIFLILAFFVLKVNRVATILLLPIIKLFYILGLVHVADMVGSFFLIKLSFMETFWAWFTNTPVLALLDFNHTLVLGGVLLALILSAPAYFLLIKGVAAYRERYRDKFNNLGVARWIKSWSISKWIIKVWPKD